MAFAWLPDDRWAHRYLVFTADGRSSGEARYEVRIEPGDLVVTSDGLRHRVVDVAAMEADARFAGFLIVQPE